MRIAFQFHAVLMITPEGSAVSVKGLTGSRVNRSGIVCIPKRDPYAEKLEIVPESHIILRE